jgi:hypothetical protein
MKRPTPKFSIMVGDRIKLNHAAKKNGVFEGPPPYGIIESINNNERWVRVRFDNGNVAPIHRSFIEVRKRAKICSACGQAIGPRPKRGRPERKP